MAAESWPTGLLVRRFFNPRTMDSSINYVSVCSYNCRPFKSNIAAVSDLCDRFDIVSIQEHWLLPNDLCLLNTFNTNISSCASSAIDIGWIYLLEGPMGAQLFYKTEHLLIALNMFIVLILE